MVASIPVGSRDWTNWQGATSVGNFTDADDPSVPTAEYWHQTAKWEPVRACLEGTAYIRANANRYLPQNPLELDDAYRGRVSRSVYTPLFNKVLRVATGLIMRRPINLEGDAFWEEFATDVDRAGTGLDEFVRDRLYLSLAYGASSWLVDFPKGEGIRTLRDQAEAQLRPYFVPVDPWSVIGWRHDPRESNKLQQVRLREMAVVQKGRFGTEGKERVRVIEPTKYELWEKQPNGWAPIENGPIAIGEIPLVTTYSGKIATLMSNPPMGELAQLSLAYYRVHSDLQQALHVAAQPILVMAGYDPSPDDRVGLSVNNAIITGPRGESEIYYVEPSVSSFDSQRAELEGLANAIKSLGMAILTEEKSGVESGKAKALDRLDSNSLLSVVSVNLERTLQQSFDMAAAYMGTEPPVVSLDRDFDLAEADAQMLGAVNTLFTSGLLDQETALRILQRGELFDDTVEIEEVMARAETEQLESMEQDMARMEGEAKIAAANAPKQAPPKG
jgi:hypothetical protein